MPSPTLGLQVGREGKREEGWVGGWVGGWVQSSELGREGGREELETREGGRDEGPGGRERGRREVWLEGAI